MTARGVSAWRRAAAAVGVLLALTGAQGPCRERGSVESDRPPQERDCRGDNCRIVIIRANGDSPYTITVVAGSEPVARGRYRQSLTYASGLKIRITVTVVYDCSIADGAHIVQRAEASAVTCVLTTRR